MVRTHSTHGDYNNKIISVRQSESLRLRPTSEDNIKTNLREAGCDVQQIRNH